MNNNDTTEFLASISEFPLNVQCFIYGNLNKLVEQKVRATHTTERRKNKRTEEIQTVYRDFSLSEKKKLEKTCKMFFENPNENSAHEDKKNTPKAKKRSCDVFEDSDGQFTENEQVPVKAQIITPEKTIDSFKNANDPNTIIPSEDICEFLRACGMPMASLPKQLMKSDCTETSTIIHYALSIIMAQAPTEIEIKKIFSTRKQEEPKLNYGLGAVQKYGEMQEYNYITCQSTASQILSGKYLTETDTTKITEKQQNNSVIIMQLQCQVNKNKWLMFYIIYYKGWIFPNNDGDGLELKTDFKNLVKETEDEHTPDLLSDFIYPKHYDDRSNSKLNLKFKNSYFVWL